MDMRTGYVYESPETAQRAGVPNEVLAKTTISTVEYGPPIRFTSGPFKKRMYRRKLDTGQLVRFT